MDQVIELVKHLINPEWIIQHGGLYMLLFIVFAETGLFVGFFLPGDSLLFLAGIYSTDLAKYVTDTGHNFTNLLLIIMLVSIAGIIGNFVGYWFGKKSGPLLFKKEDTFFFRKKHLLLAKESYDRYGGSLIIIARFLPIIRTFAPIVAGIIGMDYRKFTLYNIAGCVMWVFAMMTSGYLLGWKFPVIKDHLEWIIIGIIIVTTIPVAWRAIKSKAESKKKATP